MTAYFQLVFWLFFAHAICDWSGIQGSFLAAAKNRHTEIGKTMWGWGLFYHSLIHGGAVAYVTGSIGLGMAELVSHLIIDYAKCEKKIGLNTDQFIHLGLKLVWAAIVVFS